MTVVLHVKTDSGVTDDFNNPIYIDSTIEVNDVLVGEPSSEDVSTSVALYGKKAVYILAIPKGDTNNWEDTEVEFFGQKFRTFGFVTESIEANVPLRWNKKVKVERYG